MAAESYKAGDYVPRLAVWIVKHGAPCSPNLDDEIIADAGETFPGCKRCESLVMFHLKAYPRHWKDNPRMVSL